MNLTEFVEIGSKNGMCQITLSRLDGDHVAVYTTYIAGGDEPTVQAGRRWKYFTG